MYNNIVFIKIYAELLYQIIYNNSIDILYLIVYNVYIIYIQFANYGGVQIMLEELGTSGGTAIIVPVALYFYISLLNVL